MKDMNYFNDGNYRPENYRYVGKVNVPRKDAREILTGKCVYLDDFTLPQMLIGRALRSPYPHARIKSINIEKAAKMEGVVAILTYKDMDPNMKVGWPPTKPILGQELMYVGDPVALIAAETAEIANEAMTQIEVEYEILPHVLDGVEAVKDGAPQLYPDMYQNNIVTPGYPPFQKDGPFWHLIKGDVEAGFEECEYIAEDMVEFSKMPAPAAPEAPGAIVRWEGDENYTVWVDSQSGYICKVLNSFAAPKANLDVRTFNVGGSYGNKQSQVMQVMSALLLARRTNRPVKVFQTKQEQMCCFETRLGSQLHAKIGMDKNGVVKAVKAEWTVDTGCFSNATQGQVGVGIGEAQLVMCKCQNWDLDTNLVVTNKQPAGIVRGVGCGIIGNADIGEDNTEAYIRVVPDLVGDKAHIVLQTNITESGMGQRSNLAKMAADIMNVPYDRIEITPPETKINPTGFGLCGSRGTITYGHAISNACEDARKKLFELAVPYLEVTTDSMYLTDYGVAIKARPDKFVSWKQLIPPDLTLTGYGQHLENFSTPNMFIIFVEVEVNKETGLVKLINCLGGTDCGQAIDPSMLEMQVQSGIGSASLDTALFEEHVIDPVTSRTMTYDMIEYKWRPFNDFPTYDTCILQSQFDTFQFKATGVGEIAGAAAASATMQAITNAIGTQVTTYPATPDVILKALKEEKKA